MTTAVLNEQVQADLISILATAGIPDVIWRDHDDLCDCTFQRVCQWTNAHLGVTHEERLCCIWAKLHEMFPGCSRDIPAYFDINAQAFVPDVVPWNGEFDMPPALFHRQIARLGGISVSEARDKAKELGLEPPKGKPLPVKPTIIVRHEGEWREAQLG